MEPGLHGQVIQPAQRLVVAEVKPGPGPAPTLHHKMVEAPALALQVKLLYATKLVDTQVTLVCMLRILTCLTCHV